MNDPRYNRLLEASWQRRLAPDEEAELRAWMVTHREHQSGWEAEMSLNQALRLLPNAPVPSNFTSLVLQAVERENAGSRRGGKRAQGSWLSLLPRAAFAAVAIGACFLAHHTRQVQQRAELAQSVAAVSDVAALPSPEILQDFEAIRQLPPTPPPDDQLLALLK